MSGHPTYTKHLTGPPKGGGTRFDPTDGTWTDLPQVEGMWLEATVATDKAVWGLGPAASNPEGQPDVAIAQIRSARQPVDLRSGLRRHTGKRIAPVRPVDP